MPENTETDDMPTPSVTRYELVFTASGVVHDSTEAQRQWAAEQDHPVNEKDS